MNPSFISLGFGVVWVLAWGVALYVALRGARWAVELLPFSRDRRDAIARSSPVIATIVIFLFAIFAARTLFDGDALPFAMVLLFVGFAAASWGAIRDFVSGVVLKAEDVCNVGDDVRIGGVEGRISKLGLRALTLQTHEGETAIVPYATIARESIVKTETVARGAAHVFGVRIAPAHSPAAARALVRRAALGSHWASIVREPEVAAGPDGELKVTIFALDLDHAPEVEAAVRRAVADMDQ